MSSLLFALSPVVDNHPSKLASDKTRMTQIRFLICVIRVLSEANYDLSAVLHAWLGVFLEKVADIYCQAL